MRNAAYYKHLARRRLTGQRIGFAVAFGILLATGSFLLLGGEATARVAGLVHGSWRYDGLNGVLALIGFLLLTPLRFGIRRRTFRLARGQELPVSEIFSPFGSAALLVRLWVLKLLVRGRGALWGMGPYAASGVLLALLKRGAADERVIAVGCVGCLALGFGLSTLARAKSFLCEYLLTEKPGESPWRLFRASDRRMQGRIARLFALRLHFAGWFFLGLVGVTLPSILTYYEMTAASLAADWMEESA